jgi:hypothetical protein
MQKGINGFSRGSENSPAYGLILARASNVAIASEFLE